MGSEVRALDTDPPSGVRPVVLVVDDEPGVRESFHLILDDDYEVIDVPDGAAALGVLRGTHVDLVLLDIRLPGMDGIEVLERIKATDEGLEIILVTAVKTVRTAVAAMKLGAFDYVTKPFDEDELLVLVRRALDKRTLEREVVYLRGELERHHDFDELVGQNPEMQKIYRVVAQVARTTTTVLITGESGTGKELIARAIHHQGPRRDQPFVAVNPAAIPETLIESELFGHEKGAFTGAHQRKLGRFELAQGGTLFLDEIAHPAVGSAGQAAPRAAGARDRAGRRHARHQDRRADHRRDQRRRAGCGEPRDLSRGPLLPPERGPHRRAAAARSAPTTSRCWSDHFVQRYVQESGKRIEGLTPETLELLRGYRWPGNVRELQNVIERAVVLTDGPTIGVDDLPLELSLGVAHVLPEETLPLNEASDRFEQQMVLRALDRVHGNVSEAARMLGLHRNSLKAKLARWKIRARDLRSDAQ